MSSNNNKWSHIDRVELGKVLLKIAKEQNENNSLMEEIGNLLLENQKEDYELIELARKMIEKSLENIDSFYSTINWNNKNESENNLEMKMKSPETSGESELENMNYELPVLSFSIYQIFNSLVSP